MKIFNTNKKALIAGISLVIACSSAIAGTLPEPENPLALRKIMQEMGENMQLVVDGISREDWELVEKTAPLIAKHPQPPIIERAKILSYIGSDAKRFKGYDEKTHDGAIALSEAAAQKDGSAVISGFATLQHSCLMCHQNFRTSLQTHFYGKL